MARTDLASDHPVWRCQDCDTNNDPTTRSCTICGAGRPTPAPKEHPMPNRTSDTVTLLASTAAFSVLTTQVWASGATAHTTGLVALLSATNILFIYDGLRRRHIKHTVACPQTGCGVTMTLSGLAPDEQDRLVALAVDHSRHGGAR